VLPAVRPAHRRVCVVVNSPDFSRPFTLGGMERQLSDLAHALVRRGVDVLIVAPRSPRIATHSADGSAPAPSIHYLAPGGDFKGLGRAALWPNAQYILNAVLFLLRRRRAYDVVLVSGLRMLALPCALAGRLAGKRCVVRIETGADLTDTVSPASAGRMRRWERRALGALIRGVRHVSFALVDGLVAFSDQLQASLEAQGAAPAKIRLIPNGIDTDRFAPVTAVARRALRRRLGLPPEKIVFVYTGRLCRSKGILDLLRIWERLADRPDLFLLLVGTGASSHDGCDAEATAFAQAHPRACRVTGAVDDVAPYLQASDVFIFLSHSEALSLSMLEALSTGLPCIVTDVGGARDVVRHHEWGALVAPGAPTGAVLREIEWLLDQRKAWPRMRRLARQAVATLYTLAAVAREYVEFLDRV
jgi:glycosyltransferase involved in cell wall biosynthesis